MGLFKGKLAAATATGKRGNYILTGTHRLRIANIELKESEAGDNDWFIAEFDLISSDNPEQKGPCSIVWNMSKKPTMGNIKGLIVAIDPDLTDDEIEDAAEAMLGEDQPARGVELIATGVMKKTKAGNDFTLVAFEPVEQVVEEVAEKTKKGKK